MAIKTGELDRSEPLNGPSSAETLGTQDVLERLTIVMAAVIVERYCMGALKLLRRAHSRGRLKEDGLDDDQLELIGSTCALELTIGGLEFRSQGKRL